MRLLGRCGITCVMAVIATSVASAQTTPSGGFTSDDYMEIQQLYQAYQRGVDGGDRDSSWVFSSDGEFILGDQTVSGQQELQEFYANVNKTYPGRLRRLLSNIVILPSPEGATGSAYLFAIDAQDVDAPPTIAYFGVYRDQFVKTSDGWRLKRRVFHQDWPPGRTGPAASSSSPAAVAPPTDTVQGDPQRGAAEYRACRNCHGQSAEGGFGPDLAATGLRWTAFRRAVRQPWGIMPPFREQQKPDQALADIYAYLRTLPPTVELGGWHWRKAPETAPLGQRLYMNFAGCGQCHEPEGKFPRARLGKFAGDVTFDYFKRQIYQHYEKWPRGTMPHYSPERLPESVLREMYVWLVEELGLRPWISGALAVSGRDGDQTSYTLRLLNEGEAGNGLAAEGLTVFVRIPAGSSVVAATGTGYEGTMPLQALGLEPALRLAPHPHDDSGRVERPEPDLSRDVAVWKLARLTAGERVDFSLTLSGPEPSADLLRGFEGSTVHWVSPGRRPAGSPPRMIYQDLRMPDRGDHERIVPPAP